MRTGCGGRIRRGGAEGGGGQVADADGGVQALIHQIDDAVEEQGLACHQRVTVEKITQDRSDERAAEEDGCGDAEFTGR